MSINDLLNKIKNKIGIDKTSIMYFCIIMVVALGSFGLGRLSINNNYVKGNQFIKQNEILYNDQQEFKENYDFSKQSLVEKKYVASKNGEMYYNLGCSGAKRIKPENEIWFSSVEEAEKSGYKLSSTCKQ